MSLDGEPEAQSQGSSAFNKIDVESGAKKPGCNSCGDPVKIVFHDGVPMAAKHCRDCYAELRWGKVPKQRWKRR